LFDQGQRRLEREDHKAKYHRKDLDDGCLDDETDENGCVFGGLNSSWIAQSSTYEVPEKFPVKETPEGRPDCIDTSSNGDVARVLVPHKIAHVYRLRTAKCDRKESDDLVKKD